MKLIAMGLSHDSFSMGGRKCHIGASDDEYIPERTLCGIEGAFAFMGPEEINEEWISTGGIELCRKCAKSALNKLNQDDEED